MLAKSQGKDHQQQLGKYLRMEKSNKQFGKSSHTSNQHHPKDQGKIVDHC